MDWLDRDRDRLRNLWYKMRSIIKTGKYSNEELLRITDVLWWRTIGTDGTNLNDLTADDLLTGVNNEGLL